MSDWRQRAHSVFKSSYDSGGWAGEDAEMMRRMISQTAPSTNSPPAFHSSLLGEIVGNGAATHDRQQFVDGVRDWRRQGILDHLAETRSAYEDRGLPEDYINKRMDDHRWAKEIIPFEKDKWGKILKEAGLLEEVMK